MGVSSFCQKPKEAPILRKFEVIRAREAKDDNSEALDLSCFCLHIQRVYIGH